jgi:hypothetical protein
VREDDDADAVGRDHAAGLTKGRGHRLLEIRPVLLLRLVHDALVRLVNERLGEEPAQPLWHGSPKPDIEEVGERRVRNRIVSTADQ